MRSLSQPGLFVFDYNSDDQGFLGLTLGKRLLKKWLTLATLPKK
jgi:hypothetical protein